MYKKQSNKFESEVDFRIAQRGEERKKCAEEFRIEDDAELTATRKIFKLSHGAEMPSGKSERKYVKLSHQGPLLMGVFLC